MCATEIYESWIDRRLRYALNSGEFDILKLAEDFEMSVEDTIEMLHFKAFEMQIQFIIPVMPTVVYH